MILKSLQVDAPTLRRGNNSVASPRHKPHWPASLLPMRLGLKVPFYEFEILQCFRGDLSHAVFTRHMDIADTKKIMKILDTKSPPLSFQNQLHGTHIWLIEKNHSRDIDMAERNGDAIITNSPQTPIMIRIADCAGIFIYDPTKKVIANIHAGWRNLAQKIIYKTIERLSRKFNCTAKDLIACISPMIGPCCSSFSDPYKELPKFMHKYINEENIVNLWAAAEGHLRECGVLQKNIENPRICTVCNPEDFFSFRRDSGQKRFGTAIMLK